MGRTENLQKLSAAWFTNIAAFLSATTQYAAHDSGVTPGSWSLDVIKIVTPGSHGWSLLVLTLFVSLCNPG